jgi:hypothetical protein
MPSTMTEAYLHDLIRRRDELLEVYSPELIPQEKKKRSIMNEKTVENVIKVGKAIMAIVEGVFNLVKVLRTSKSQ